VHSLQAQLLPLPPPVISGLVCANCRLPAENDDDAFWDWPAAEFNKTPEMQIKN
jgi:hypothetical protein